jgi:UDP-N-acetylmuramate--alanine ligase
MKDQKVLAVAGTHGKTTTSSLLTYVMRHAKKDPTFVVGGILANFQTNAEHGTGEYFVAEADESDGTFLKYSSFGAIVTNIDRDHMNYFKTEEVLIQSFKNFFDKVISRRHLLWCNDDPHLREINPAGINYGFSEDSQARISNFRQHGWHIVYDLTYFGTHYPDIEVALTGRHNALNSCAVFVLALTLDLEEADIRQALKTFKGVGRRTEKKGEKQGIQFIDDYGHHPTEIGATLKAIKKAIGDKRLVAIFQPHRYTRTQECMGTFGPAFHDADLVVITDIYSAGETPIFGISTQSVMKEIEEVTECVYIPRNEIPKKLHELLYPHDVVVTVGAGDVTKISKETLEHFEKKHPHKLKVGLICGGRSNEHEVSLSSVRNIHYQLKEEYYKVELFGITKKGAWITGNDTFSRLELLAKESNEKDDIPKITQEIIKKLLECDIIFPVLHGPFGEDGTLQGFLETLGMPYVGCDHRSAAICMDKAMTKRLMQLNDIPTLPFVSFNQFKWQQSRDEILTEIKQKLTYPVFVKPLHLGSSMGVIRVNQPDDLTPAINKAFKVDSELLVENGVVNPREIEFSLLGNDRIQAFPPGEVHSEGSIYTYDSKYGPQAITTSPKAPNLTPEQVKEGMKWARAAYVAVGGQGMARVDFFLDGNGHWWLNEINPIPGFTNTSLYPKMCEVNGLAQSELMDQLIILGFQRHRKNRCLRDVRYG